MEHPDLHQDFRTHFQTVYADQGRDYPTYEPAYQFGSELALDEAFRQRPYDEAEADLRARYARRYPNSDFDTMAEAVRYAYEQTRRRTQS